MADPDEIVRRLSADKARIMEAQRQLLERRYNLQPQLDTEAKMSARQASAGGAHGASGAGHDMGSLGVVES